MASRLCNVEGCPEPRVRPNQPKCREHYNAYMRDWGRRNPTRVHGVRLARVYGITRADYEALLERQGGVCAICRKPQKLVERRAGGHITNLAVDHDHVSGEVRGLLCLECNALLARAADNAERLHAAARYLSEKAWVS